jgi:hypothetical protein
MTFHLNNTRPTAYLAILAASVGILSGCSFVTSDLGTTSSSPSSSANSTPNVTIPSAPTDPVAAAAWEALMAPEGEYAAAASYAAVIDKFGAVEPYVSIKAAEEKHIEALTRQLERLGVTVPDNPWLGNLAAPSDLATAAQAWADGEVANVALYDRLLSEVSSSSSLTRVFTNLQRASQEQHLPMFQAAADSGGALTTKQMQAISH